VGYHSSEESERGIGRRGYLLPVSSLGDSWQDTFTSVDLHSLCRDMSHYRFDQVLQAQPLFIRNSIKTEFGNENAGI